ncbi:MAG TPA: carboxypeptidase regulatory-like domain-containing protein [Kofleriaceae bacterium]|nr:carboxypeptidase regulatory-like domain-containing protein [Kofleriaceae bacterium]
MRRLALALALGWSALAHGEPAIGSIKGTVLFEGEPPEQPKQKRDADPKCSQDRAEEAIVVHRGKLRDVVVRIANGSTGLHAAPSEPVVIDQRDCMYVPRVVGIVAGQHVVVRNSDNTFHDVWGELDGKTLWNKPQGPKARDLELDPAAHADDVVELKCGAHPWMHAYIAVQDSPFFAVTGDDGAFEIKGVPEGTYTLEAWHPVLGTRSLRVVIGRGKRADITARFSYKARDM